MTERPSPHAPGASGGPAPVFRQPVPWRSVAAGPAVALGALLAALLATRSAGVGLRDPEHVTALRLVVAGGLVVALVGVDVVLGAYRREGRRRPSRAALRSIRRERWSAGRMAVVGVALVSFYVTYLAYRNLKSVVPLLRPGELFDRQLSDLDRDLIGGSDPAAVLHDLLGTGIAAHALSVVYMAFFVFIPVALALALVFSSELRKGLFFTTALSMNWLLGAGSYFLAPSLGPFHLNASAFATLPATPVSALQELLLSERTAFLRDPAVAGAAQSIGAFASLHVSIYFTAALAAHLLGLRPWVKAGLWVLTALTVTSTIYFGWHYLLDDVAGVAIAIMALALARLLTGCELGLVQRLRRMPAPAPEPA